MKKFFGEFKKFISRGNVMDLAVGVIIGSAFTAIVTALTSKIIQPLINFVIYLITGGKGGIEGVYTILVGSSSDLANAIYIDWGAFISAIINFLLVAWVLFLIVKLVNKLNEQRENLKQDFQSSVLTKAEKKEMKNRGLNYKNQQAVKMFKEQKRFQAEAAKKKAEAEAKAKEEEAKKHTTEYLLEEIKNLLQEQKNKQE